MAFSDSAKNTMLDALTITHISGHSGDPGTTGANELTGDNYARIAATVGAAAGGERQLTGTHTITVPAGSTISHVAYWNNTTFICGDDLPSAETYTAEGSYDLTGFLLKLNG